MSNMEIIELQGQGPTYSIFKETWAVIKKHFDLLLFAALGVAILYGGLYELSPIKLKDLSMPISEMCDEQMETEACKAAHREEIRQEAEAVIKKGKENAPVLFLLFLGWVVSIFVGYYYLSMTYLKRVLTDVPRMSEVHFWRYARLILWKYIRPLCWNIIPLLGQFMYVRSLLKYELVGYLTLMGHPEPLKESWNRTEGNLWRIYGVQFAWGIIFSLVCLPVLIMEAFIVDTENALSFLIRGVQTGPTYMIGIFVSFVVMSVLTKEREAKEVTASHETAV